MKIGNLEIYGVIYKIENLINGKVYIGQTIQEGGFDDRYNRSGEGIEKVYLFHKYKKNNKTTYNKHLLGAIEKYGFNAFSVIKIFDIAFSQKELDIKEQCWIGIYNSYKNGYNKTLGGAGHGGGKLDEQWRKNISEACKGKIVPKEIKNKISKSMSEKMSKQMICLNTLKIFNTPTEGEILFGIYKRYISKCCRRELNFINQPNTRQPYCFLYYDDYLQMTNEEIQNIIKTYILGNTVKDVICLNTLRKFTYIELLNDKYNIQYIKKVCEGKGKSCGKHPITGEKLRWMYYEDYIKQNKLLIHYENLVQAI